MTSPSDGPAETIEQIIASVVGARVKGRYRKALAGTVTRYEPLNYGGNDVLIKDDTGRECWYSSHEILRDNGEPLPSRRELQQRADCETAAALRDIREQHISDFNHPWPGLEFGKGHFGQMLDCAISDVEGRSKGGTDD